MKTLDIYPFDPVLWEKTFELQWETIELEAFLAREGISPEQSELIRNMGPYEALDVVNKDGVMFSVSLTPIDEVDPSLNDPVDDDEPREI